MNRELRDIEGFNKPFGLGNFNTRDLNQIFTTTPRNGSLGFENSPENRKNGLKNGICGEKSKDRDREHKLQPENAFAGLTPHK